MGKKSSAKRGGGGGGRDRQLFRRMIAETLEGQGLPAYTSQKERSKQRPWV